MQWSIRSLLNPVIARCLIYGVNGFDLESVLNKVEKVPMTRAKALENAWMTEWTAKAERFLTFAKAAKEDGNELSYSEYNGLAAKCFYACYLLNSDAISYKQKVYERLEETYREYLMFSNFTEEEVKIPFQDGRYLPAYLHLPEKKAEKESFPCVIISGGIGSCKEEFEVMSRPLVERGIAVLALDMPGTGSALFHQGLKLHADNINQAMDSVMQFLKGHPSICSDKIGTYGLCMGGGYSYHWACRYPEIKCVVTLFPLFVSMLGDNSVPRWMKQGEWSDFQTDFQGDWIADMKKLEDEALSCDYLLVHSEYDNWMELNKTNQLFEKCSGMKKEIIIHDEPVYATKESVMHAMPVGEQMHWIKLQAADFFFQQFRK